MPLRSMTWSKLCWTNAGGNLLSTIYLQITPDFLDLSTYDSYSLVLSDWEWVNWEPCIVRKDVSGYVSMFECGYYVCGFSFNINLC